MKYGAFKMGWIMLMFDLPTTTKREQSQANKFRQGLLKEGFTMLQFSVYTRACIGYDHMKKKAKHIENIIPNNGNVRVFFITDKQWEKSICVIGQDYQAEKQYIQQEIPNLFDFW